MGAVIFETDTLQMPQDLTPAKQRFPWEPVPIEDTVAALQQDFAYAVQFTAVLVHANRPELEMLVNTRRGQIIPRGECLFMDGTKIEFQDIGMCQPNCAEMSIPDLIAHVFEIARSLGLEMHATR